MVKQTNGIGRRAGAAITVLSVFTTTYASAGLIYILSVGSNTNTARGVALELLWLADDSLFSMASTSWRLRERVLLYLSDLFKYGETF